MRVFYRQARTACVCAIGLSGNATTGSVEIRHCRECQPVWLENQIVHRLLPLPRPVRRVIDIIRKTPAVRLGAGQLYRQLPPAALF